MSASDTLRIEQSQAVAFVTFDRPKHNVFNIEMMERFCAVLADLAENRELKCLVLKGEGRSWCAGVDVGDHKPDKVHWMIDTFNRSLTLLSQMPFPTVAAVHGACLGGGMEYAIACDAVFAAQKATFGQPEVKLGFLPPYAAVRLPGLVGPARAVEICTSGRIYAAEEGLRMGFVSHVAGDETFENALNEFVAEFRSSSPLILRLNKQAVNQHLGLSPSDALNGVSDLFLSRLMKSRDTLEGIASFYEKRKPAWKNA